MTWCTLWQFHPKCLHLQTKTLQRFHWSGHYFSGSFPHNAIGPWTCLCQWWTNRKVDNVSLWIDHWLRHARCKSRCWLHIQMRTHSQWWKKIYQTRTLSKTAFVCTNTSKKPQTANCQSDASCMLRSIFRHIACRGWRLACSSIATFSNTRKMTFFWRLGPVYWTAQLDARDYKTSRQVRTGHQLLYHSFVT